MLKNGLLVLFLLLLALFTRAQYRVTIRLLQVPVAHRQEAVFISGSFNSWQPGDSSYRILPAEFQEGKTILLPAGLAEFKCTRGNWNTPECAADGMDVSNRYLKLNSDTVININIAGWKDDFAAAEKKHTASPQVTVMDTAFFIPQLNRYRRIWIYLPANYASSKQHYPVLYMHDGQNLFDEYTSGYGEWGVDECLDSLTQKGVPSCIVIGIDNGPRRFNEYNPWYFERFGNGEGNAYADFLVKTLKPFVDKHYRTLPSKENTSIAGSSMGGLISFYTALSYPTVFGKAGVFSPAFWTAASINGFTDSNAVKQNGKLFFYMGGLEGGSYIEDMKNIVAKMGNLSSAMIYTIVDDESAHNEKAWRKWFPEFYRWIMADGFNNVIKLQGD